jgi:hypothetical protein
MLEASQVAKRVWLRRDEVVVGPEFLQQRKVLDSSDGDESVRRDIEYLETPL